VASNSSLSMWPLIRHAIQTHLVVTAPTPRSHVARGKGRATSGKSQSAFR
jgi:hypothetical protein